MNDQRYTSYRPLFILILISIIIDVIMKTVGDLNFFIAYLYLWQNFLIYTVLLVLYSLYIFGLYLMLINMEILIKHKACATTQHIKAVIQTKQDNSSYFGFGSLGQSNYQN